MCTLSNFLFWVHNYALRIDIMEIDKFNNSILIPQSQTLLVLITLQHDYIKQETF